MTKRELINEIMEINRTADAAFLADFDVDQLEDYLGQLYKVNPPRVKAQSTQSARAQQYMPEKPISQMSDDEIDHKLSQVLDGMISVPELRVVRPSNHNLGALDGESDKHWLF